MVKSGDANKRKKIIILLERLEINWNKYITNY